MSAGYSGKPLVEKLGVKPDTTLVLIDAPDEAERLLEPLPAGSRLRHGNRGRRPVDTKVCAIDEAWSGLRLTPPRT